MSSGKEYIELKIPNTDMMVLVNLGDEGVIVDVFSDKVEDGPIATTWRTYSELGKEVKDEDDNKIAFTWQVEDVKSLDDTLSDQDCVNILKAFEQHHEGSMEQMRLDLKYHIDEYKQEQATMQADAETEARAS